MKTILLLLLFTYFLSDTFPTNTTSATAYNKGILWISTNKLATQSDTLFLYNHTAEKVGGIYSLGTEKSAFFGVDGNKAHAFYSEFDVLVFDCDPINNNQYKVQLGNDSYFVPHTQGITHYTPWEEHVMSYFVLLENNQNIYSNYTTKKEIPTKDLSDHNFNVTKIKGEWIYVVCEEEYCCPKDKPTQGWVRWRNKDKILIEMRYTC